MPVLLQTQYNFTRHSSIGISLLYKQLACHRDLHCCEVHCMRCHGGRQRVRQHSAHNMQAGWFIVYTIPSNRMSLSQMRELLCKRRFSAVQGCGALMQQKQQGRVGPGLAMGGPGRVHVEGGATVKHAIQGAAIQQLTHTCIHHYHLPHKSLPIQVEG